MPQQKKRKHVSKITFFSLFLALGVILLTAVLVNLWIYPYRMQKNRNQQIEYLYSVQEKERTVTPVVLTPKPTMQAFKKGPQIKRHTFDTSLWKTYRNESVGFSFKYPEEWGDPTSDIIKGHIGYFLSVHFPYSRFIAGGSTKDFMYPSEGSILNFKGFDLEPSKKICENYKTIYCQISEKSVHFVNSTVFGPMGLGAYSRFYLADRPNKEISGLVFGGGFLSKQTRKYIDNFSEDDTVEIEAFNKAVVERKIDEESMKNFDLYEKIFETIELW
jgi:hypothetical protein